MKAIIFDIDGTIVDIPEYAIIQLYQTIASQLSKPRPTSKNIFKHWCGEDEESILEEMLVDNLTFWEAFKKNDNLDFRKKYAKPFQDIHVLNVLQKKGIKIVFNTDAPYKHGFTQLEKCGLKSPIVVDNHNGIPRKPAPDGLIKAMELLDVSPYETLYVGNTQKDIITGLRAGTQTALINRNTIQPILAVTPDYVIESLDDILTLPFQTYSKLIRDISIDNVTKELSAQEKNRLTTHFKRIRHHSLLLGILCQNMSKELKIPPNQGFLVGTFHDIDYALSFFDMKSHGSNVDYFTDEVLCNEQIIDYIREHNSLPKSRVGKFLYAMEGWLKRFVHVARSQVIPPNQVTFEQIRNIYKMQDPRQNELLTHYDNKESYEEFKHWQRKCEDTFVDLGIDEQKLFQKVIYAFNTYTRIVSSEPVNREGGIIYGKD